jgi:hypothetical protein
MKQLPDRTAPGARRERSTAMTEHQATLAPRRRVRVWFGSHVIADYRAEADLAERYEAAMARRFSGLKITVDDLPETEPAEPRALPGELLWQLAP